MNQARTAEPAKRSSRADHRDSILRAAAALLAEGGRDALSTRAISEAAGVQAPTIYRIFNDKRGLLDALASEGLREYYAADETRLQPTADPVADLRRGFHTHIAFGLAHPALYGLIYGEPREGRAPPAAVDAALVLRDLMRRIGQAGRLRVSEEQAARLFFAAGCGTVFTLLATSREARDPGLADVSCNAFLNAVIADPPAPDAPDPVIAAVATLRTALEASGSFTGAERSLFEQWLDRLSQDRDDLR